MTNLPVECIKNVTDIYRLFLEMEQAVSTSFTAEWSQRHLTLQPTFLLQFTEILLTFIG
jgi:hypothetical protein